MRKLILTLAIVAPLSLMPIAANAKGCLKGAAVGAVAGHYAGHHAIKGALAGCIAGHYVAKAAAAHKASVAQKALAAPATTPAH